MDDDMFLNDVVDDTLAVVNSTPVKADRLGQSLGTVSRYLEKCIAISRYNHFLTLYAEINLRGARNACSIASESPDDYDRRIAEQSREQLTRNILESGLTFISKRYLRSEIQRACPSF
ncbi:MAG: hypothetical protein V1866_03600 [archaeon]